MLSFFRRSPHKGNTNPPRPRLTLDPVPERLVAIGDVHGCLDELVALEQKLHETVGSDGPIIMLGDYIDRGPDSAGTLDHLLAAASKPALQRICLGGNHEQMLLDAYDRGNSIENWLSMGGLETLVSYGASHRDLTLAAGKPDRLRQIMHSHIPQEHIEFLRALPVAVLASGYLFVHAGVRSGVALEVQSDDDLMWSRTNYASHPHDLGLCVVHGHTPVTEPVANDQHINIDTGVFMTGQLTAASIIENSAPQFIQN